jgi:hypothetical protein
MKIQILSEIQEFYIGVRWTKVDLTELFWYHIKVCVLPCIVIDIITEIRHKK